MHRLLRRSAVFLSLLAFALGGPHVAANPVGDFFKKVGRSISSIGKKTPPKPKPKKSGTNGERDEATAGSKPAGMTPSPTPFATLTPSPTPLEIRPATSAPSDQPRSRDLPYGVAVPNRPGLVTSPYA
ncbi:MAG: hypothetical protein ABIR29_09645, partial [Chthoniobacterales bacterium]